MTFSRMAFSKVFTAEHAVPRVGQNQNAEIFKLFLRDLCVLRGKIGGK
jgi:hypothetical protein